MIQTPPTTRIRTQNEFIVKPQLDEGEAYREAIRREAKVAPQQVASYLERIEHTAGQLLGRPAAQDRPAWKSD